MQSISIITTVYNEEDCLHDYIEEIIKVKNFAKEGDTIVVVAGMPFGISGSTNSIRVVEI